jgi:small redox-active disulfide protein 2
MEIKVLGPGCPKCEQTAKLAMEVVAETGVDADVVKITDFQEIAKTGVFSTPGVVIDGEVKCTGRAPSRDELKAWIAG